jgi:hypothetical protein
MEKDEDCKWRSLWAFINHWEKLYVLTCISETGTGFVNFKESKKLTI